MPLAPTAAIHWGTYFGFGFGLTICSPSPCSATLVATFIAKKSRALKKYKNRVSPQSILVSAKALRLRRAGSQTNTRHRAGT